MDMLTTLSLSRRTECNDEGCATMPVSNWQKTGIPVIISVVLFFIVFVILFFIVRRHRLKVKKQEESEQGKIDLEDVEDRAAFRAGRKQ